MNNYNQIFNYIKEYVEDPNNRYSTFKMFKKLNDKHIIKIIKDKHKHLYNIDDVKELVYHTYNNLKDIPKCESCGCVNKFKSFSEGYSKYCSKKCQINSVNKIRNDKKKSKTLYFKATPDELKEFLKTKFPKPGLTKSLLNSFKDTEWLDIISIDGVDNLNQLIYMFINDIIEVPVCSVCKKNKLKYLNFRTGFEIACSRKCISHNFWNTLPDERRDIIAKKSGDTFKKRYGVGTDGNVLLQNKKKINYIKKWGDTHYMKTDKGLKMFEDNIRDKYGVRNIMQDDNVYKKINDNSKKFKEYRLKTGEVLKTQGYNGIIFDFLLDYYNRDLILHEHETTTFKYSNDKLYRPDFEIKGLDQIYEVKSWWWFYNKIDVNIQKMYSVLKSGYDYSFLVLKDSNTKKPIELTPYCNDHYIQEIIDKLDLQDNRILYTTDGFLLIDYRLCIRVIRNLDGYLNKEYQLSFRGESNQYCKTLILYEDQILNKLDIIKNRLFNIMGLSNKIYARKCIVKKVDKKVAKQFYNINHMQGSPSTLKYSYGLYYNNDLVSLMSFGGLRKSLGQKQKEGSFELLRFCNRLGYSVIGGASKLMKVFENEVKPDHLISYADYSWSDGGVYNNLGFIKTSLTDPGYWYMVEDKREHRFKYNKQSLVSMGYDPNKTEKQIMKELNIPMFYDCGNLKFEKYID